MKGHDSGLVASGQGWAGVPSRGEPSRRPSGTDTDAKRVEFRRLHDSGCFVIANPWDRGSARYLQHLGFRALTTTSAGFAFSRGLPDVDWVVSREMALGYIADIVSAADVPVNADFESGYAHAPEDVARNVRLCVATGVAGLSIEDLTGDARTPQYELPLAVERIAAARAAIDESGASVLLTARAETYYARHPKPLDEAIRRLKAYADAGADVLFTPGVIQPEDIRLLVNALQPKPVNILMSMDVGLRVSDLADLGVRRISLGSAPWRAAWTAFARASQAIAREGSFAGFDNLIPFAEVHGFFREDFARRSSQ